MLLWLAKLLFIAPPPVDNDSWISPPPPPPPPPPPAIPAAAILAHVWKRSHSLGRRSEGTASGAKASICGIAAAAVAAAANCNLASSSGVHSTAAEADRA
jgi:hypothetical protein